MRGSLAAERCYSHPDSVLTLVVSSPNVDDHVDGHFFLRSPLRKAFGKKHSTSSDGTHNWGASAHACMFLTLKSETRADVIVSPPPLLHLIFSAPFLFSLFRRAESQTEEGPAPCRTGFYYSERYCPAVTTGPQRPPPPQDLLSASLKLTGLPRPSRGRFRGGELESGGARGTPPWLYPDHQADRGTEGRVNGERLSETWGNYNNYNSYNYNNNNTGKAAAAHQAWATSNGKAKATDGGGAAWPANGTERSSSGGDDHVGPPRPPPPGRRFGTYERERLQRRSVLHYLTLATTSQPPTGAGSAASAGAAVNPPASVVTHPRGATPAALLAVMRERPWEGQPGGAGTAQEWSEWLEYLEPTIERHLRWLAVDGLAAQSNIGAAPGNCRYVALETPLARRAFLAEGKEERLRMQEEVVEPGGQESAGRLAAPVAGGRVAAAGGAEEPGADMVAEGPSMLAGGVRIMKSRPIKMVKPWR